MAMRLSFRSLISKTLVSSPLFRRLSSRPLIPSPRPLSLLRTAVRLFSSVRLDYEHLPPTFSLRDPLSYYLNLPIPYDPSIGCDYKHWRVFMENPHENTTRDDIIDSYIKTLSKVFWSEEEARMKIYVVSTKHYFAFGALVSEELSTKIRMLPGVRKVVPDSYEDLINKDYGGEPFINGQAVPYKPKYHEHWLRHFNKWYDKKMEEWSTNKVEEDWTTKLPEEIEKEIYRSYEEKFGENGTWVNEVGMGGGGPEGPLP